MKTFLRALGLIIAASMPIRAAPSSPPAGNFILNVSTTLGQPAFNVSSGTILNTFYLPFLTNGQCVTVNAGKQVIGIACGGSGASSLAVTTGNASGFSSVLSSPTAVINFDSSTFNLNLAGAATVYVLPNPSSVTLQGNNLSATYLTNSSATATYLQLSSATATYLTISSASATYFNLNNILSVARGGTGTSSPGLIAGTNIGSITGTWPNQTINASSTLVTSTASVTVGNCAKFSAATGLLDAGAACGVGGGGTSALGISSGSAINSVVVSSPTSNIVFDSNTINVSLQGATTSFASLKPSSVTLQGQNVIDLTSSLQSGATFFVSSGTVNGPFLVKSSNVNMIFSPGSGTGGTGTLWLQGADGAAPSKFDIIYSALSDGTTISHLLFSNAVSGNQVIGWNFEDGSAAVQASISNQGTISGKNISSTYNVSAGSITGAGLGTCGDATHGLGYNSSNLFTCQSITGAGGGGASTLGISSGSAITSVIVSSPTSNVVYDSNTFIVSLQGSSTSFIKLNPSSATLQGFVTPASIGATTLGSFSATQPILYNSGTGAFSSTLISATTGFMGTLQAAQFPALTGDITTSGGSLATTAAAVQNNIVTFGSSITVNGAGGITSKFGVSAATGTFSSLTSGQCVQAGTGGLLTVSGSACASTAGFGQLSGTQTWTGQNNWTTPAQSTFTYGLTVGSMTVNGPGNGVMTLTISGSTYTATSSSDTITAGHLAKWSTTNYTLIDGGVSSGGGGTPAGNSYDVQVDSNGAFGGYDNFQNNGTTVSVVSADATTFTNYNSVIYSGFNSYAFSGMNVTLDNASPLTTASSVTITGTGGLGVTAGPLNLASQATPLFVNGNVWNDSTQQTLSYVVNNTTTTGSSILWTMTASSAVFNTATETAIISTVTTTGIGTLNLPANFFSVGKTIYLVLAGTYTTTATPTLDIKIKMGGTTILDSGVITLTTVTGTDVFTLSAHLTCRTLGSSGSIMAVGQTVQNTSTIATAGMDLNSTLTTVNTTIAEPLSVTITWGAASASNNLTFTNGFVSVLN